MDNPCGALLPEKEPIPNTQTPIQPNSNPSDQPPSYTHPSQFPSPSGGPYSQGYPPPTTGMGYPQFYSPPPGGEPYYPPPGFAYPGPPVASYQTPPQQQQQQQVVVVNTQPTAAAIVVRSTVSMSGAIVLSCFVFWCCGWVFGGIAFMLAMVGQCKASEDDERGAIRLRSASYGVSIAGFVCGIVIIAIVIGVSVSSGPTRH